MKTLRTIIYASVSVFIIGVANADLVINEIDLAGNRVELVNTGVSTLNIENWWFCNLVTGAPVYSQISSYAIDSGLSSASVFTSVGAGQHLVVNLIAAVITDGNGELGVYRNNADFGNAANIEDYILWGAFGTRDSVAQTAGIWTDNDFIDVSSLNAGETIQLRNGFSGDQASDYLIGAGTLGAITNVPEPSSFVLFGLGLLAFLKRHKVAA